jgi:hypothetical protein
MLRLICETICMACRHRQRGRGLKEGRWQWKKKVKRFEKLQLLGFVQPKTPSLKNPGAQKRKLHFVSEKKKEGKERKGP